ncbi:MAG: GTPase ObgE [Candidatus Saccharimonadales bacterium]
MFVDKTQVTIKAGDGGNGYVSFRHEKYVDKGGPDGGDGGRGGNVVFVASRNQNTLAAFRYQRELTATDGNAGFNQRKHGRNGADLNVAVPVGTLVTNSDGNLIADLKEDGQTEIIARGGKGGFGNAHFVSSTRQAPRVAEKGELGDVLEATLELKMIADVGLVGLPNAGKSTLLARISNARPEIADYPFTTLRPNLGVVDIDKDNSLLFADIPGLIEGASNGKGLGDEFLRHVERTAVLVHLIDIYNDVIPKAYKTIQQELAAYDIDLTVRPQIVVLTKVEGLDSEIIKEKLAELQPHIPADTPLLAMSAQSGLNIKDVLFAVMAMVNRAREVAANVEAEEVKLKVFTLPDTGDSWYVKKVEDGYEVTGPKIERFAARTDFEDYHGVQRLRDIMNKMGIMHGLRRHGIEAGEKVTIGKNIGSFDY